VSATVKPNEKKTAPKAVQASLKAIWRGLRRCHRYPSIYHDLWEPQSPIEQAFPDIRNPVSRIIGGTSVVVYDVPDVSGINHSFKGQQQLRLWDQHENCRRFRYDGGRQWW
jgi:hypothetical protein